LSQHLISGSALSGVRNTVYDVDGKRVQINVIVTPDAGNAEKLMTRLRSMKAEIALLQKKRTIYEFIGQNDVLPLIAEGHKYL
jgi:phosphoribosylpyrophosphate synthetase